MQESGFILSQSTNATTSLSGILRTISASNQTHKLKMYVTYCRKVIRKITCGYSQAIPLCCAVLELLLWLIRNCSVDIIG